MTYTVQLDFFIDTDDIMTDETVKEVVKEIFDSCNCSASDIRVLEVNDCCGAQSPNVYEVCTEEWAEQRLAELCGIEVQYE